MYIKVYIFCNINVLHLKKWNCPYKFACFCFLIKWNLSSALRSLHVEYCQMCFTVIYNNYKMSIFSSHKKSKCVTEITKSFDFHIKNIQTHFATLFLSVLILNENNKLIFHYIYFCRL